MALDLRIAENEQDAVLAFQAYKQMHDEGGVPGGFVPLKTLTNILRMMKGPGSCVLMAMDGEKLAGIISLYQQAYWYGDDRHLIDKGLYVLPEYRDSEALDLLMSSAQHLSDDLGIPCYLFIFNAKRRRGALSKWERIGATLGYTNRGAIIAHFPEN